ncbi:uncharacterized protein AMSG_07990 [Thecamonas trahens ATCC 50062]|uniref:Uncharacterized protein n=1 Tax=Thecamonas trahens ATCC 50062 TaxID=461836 RepID=A0A0L0DIF3_THETB|nr:hypothetical protein AMSG_07990 [Thecamonas trahens ATCC 50062]KNC51891.1 hypothetical protein AMSG_07990 [Thecamonas trahens ATCC 50062]|eukprot:XP_013755748.1 hypothetical protein AMSG_07990 [Thecamonas trahens ATCC 50062]
MPSRSWLVSELADEILVLVIQELEAKDAELPEDVIHRFLSVTSLPLAKLAFAEAWFLDECRACPDYGGGLLSPVVVGVGAGVGSSDDDADAVERRWRVELVVDESSATGTNPRIELGHVELRLDASQDEVGYQGRPAVEVVAAVAAGGRFAFGLDEAYAHVTNAAGDAVDVLPLPASDTEPRLVTFVSDAVAAHLTGTFVPLPEQVARAALPTGAAVDARDLVGLYASLYGEHGPELIAVVVMEVPALEAAHADAAPSWPVWPLPPSPLYLPPDQHKHALVGFKIFGDPNVPACAPTFAFGLGMDDELRLESENVATTSNGPADGLRVLHGCGRIAMTGYRQSSWSPAVLVLSPQIPDRLAVTWLALNATTNLYNRLSVSSVFLLSDLAVDLE